MDKNRFPAWADRDPYRRKVFIALHSLNARCSKNPRNKDYSNYAGRGIEVCCVWRGTSQASFISFLMHVGLPPSLDHSIDRINNDGNYEPGNVRWATQQEQALNRTARTRDAEYVVYKNKRDSLWIVYYKPPSGSYKHVKCFGSEVAASSEALKLTDALKTELPCL